MRNAKLFCFFLVAVMSLSAFQIMVEEAQAKQVDFIAADELPLVEAAREDINAFIEFCSPLKQSAHHKRLQATWSEHENTVCLFPIEHGKTVQTIWSMVWHMGTYPDKSFAYISSGERPAKKVIRAVKRIIETNVQVHKVFPNLKPELEFDGKGKTCWGSLELRVEGAPAEDKDPTLAGYGYDGQVSGSRLWGVWIDNVCNKKNTYTPNMRASVLESIENDIHSRILDGGFCHITDTSWYDDDPPHVLGKRVEWFFVVEDAEKGDIEGETLWPEQWSWERLQKKRGIIGPMAYDRTLRNITTSASRGTFKKEFIDPYIGIVPWFESKRWAGSTEPVRVVTGVDLAVGQTSSHDETVFFTGLQVGNKYQLLNICALRIDGTDILREIIRIYEAFHIGADSSEIKVESNAAQKYIVQMVKDESVMKALGASKETLSSLYVTPFQTTVVKRDLDYGIPSLAADLQMDRWMFPSHPEVEKLKQELLQWSPEAHTGDRVMAMWFCREGLRTVGFEDAAGSGTREGATT